MLACFGLGLRFGGLILKRHQIEGCGCYGVACNLWSDIDTQYLKASFVCRNCFQDNPPPGKHATRGPAKTTVLSKRCHVGFHVILRKGKPQKVWCRV